LGCLAILGRMVTIRAATTGDEPELRRLELESPQGQRTRLFTERSAFFYRSGLFSKAQVLLAVEGSRAVGAMAYAVKEVFVEGKIVPAAYVYDVRSDQGYRRSMKRGLWQLWQALHSAAQAEGAHFIYGHVKEDNVHALRVFTKGGAQEVGGFRVVLIPTRPGHTTISPVADWRGPVAELEGALGRRDLRPPRLGEIYARGEALGHLGGVYRVEKRGGLAQVSVWDASSVQRHRVLAIPFVYRVLGQAINPMARILPLPRVPQPGQAVLLWHLFDVMAVGRSGPRLLSQILVGLLHRARAHGVDLVGLFTSMGDPLARLPPILLKKQMVYRTLALALGGALPRPPLYLDIRDL